MAVQNKVHTPDAEFYTLQFRLQIFPISNRYRNMTPLGIFIHDEYSAAILFVRERGGGKQTHNTHTHTAHARASPHTDRQAECVVAHGIFFKITHKIFILFVIRTWANPG